MKLAPYLVIISSLTITTCTWAQYVWIDENGHKQYSDQAPPASVPEHKILKMDGKLVDHSSPTPSNSEVKPAESWAEKNAAYKKRQEELLAKEKKAESETKMATAKSDYCKRAKEYKQTLESNQPIATVDATGARTYMSEEKRAQDLDELRQNMSECEN